MTLTRSSPASLACLLPMLLSACSTAYSTRDDDLAEPASAPHSISPNWETVVIASTPPKEGVHVHDISIDVTAHSLYSRWPAGSTPDSAAADSPRLFTARWADDAELNRLEDSGAPSRTWIVERRRLDHDTPINLEAISPGGPSDSLPGTLLRRMHLVETEGGGLAIASEIDFSERVKVDFLPPMWVLPSELPTDGSVCVFERVKMTVRNLETDAVKAEGTADHSVCYEGFDTIATSLGQIQAHRIVSRFKADLGPSIVSNITTQWFAPTLGLVAERRRERTSALGLTVRTNAENWLIEQHSR